MLDTRSMQALNCQRSATQGPALYRDTRFPVRAELAGYILKRFEAIQLLGHQNGPGVTFNLALAEKNRDRYRYTTFL